VFFTEPVTGLELGGAAAVRPMGSPAFSAKVLRCLGTGSEPKDIPSQLCRDQQYQYLDSIPPLSLCLRPLNCGGSGGGSILELFWESEISARPLEGDDGILDRTMGARRPDGLIV
jgi:hypothetical protein